MGGRALFSRFCAGMAGWTVMAGMWCGIALAQQVPPAEPADEAGEIVRAVPLGVVEVVIGGNWKDGQRSGVYRAVVVQSSGRDGARTASVHLQWIAENEDGALATLVNSVGIREVNDKGLQDVSIALDGAGENVARLTIDAPEAADPVMRRTVVLVARPGKYAVVPAKASEAAAEGGTAGGTAEAPLAGTEAEPPAKAAAAAVTEVPKKPARKKIRKRSKSAGAAARP